MAPEVGPFSLERAVNAVERVRQRLLRAARALGEAGVDYAVAGGNAVALWVSRVDEAAVRNTQDVDILIRRVDFQAAKRALESAGFVHRHAAGIDAFLDSDGAKFRDAVHIVYANELVKPGEPAMSPDVTESEKAGAFRVLSLRAVVAIKLTAFRDKDRTHLRDLIEVGLVDRTWLTKLEGELKTRLQLLLDNPEG
ncbi:MAG: nucleotidyltransferase family protein [Phycisphaerales bacterium]|nr:nucleotidyltransferase family protein [Phycisphaerales bacterium]